MSSKHHFKVKTISILCCLAILFITAWAPCMEDSPLGTDIQRKLLNYSLWLFVAMGLFFRQKMKKPHLFDGIVIIAVLVHRGFNIFYAYNYKGLGLTTIVVSLFICIQSDEIRASVFKYFKYLMVASSVIGIICYISYTLNLGIPYTVVERGGGIYWIDYKSIYLLNQYNTMIRFNGFFEEPGWYGTWAAFYLCADRLNFKKKENVILLIGGLLTFSLAFVLLLVVYYILLNLSEWKRWIWVAILAAIYLFVIPNIKTGNYAIDRVLERMVITSEGLVGDNRSGTVFEKVWQQALRSGKIWTGYGAGYAEAMIADSTEGLASIKSYLVNFGIIGTVIIFVPIFIASIVRSRKLKSRDMLLYVLITYVSLYQRPYLFWTPYLIIYLCGMSYIAVKRTEQSKKGRQRAAAVQLTGIQSSIGTDTDINAGVSL